MRVVFIDDKLEETFDSLGDNDPTKKVLRKAVQVRVKTKSSQVVRKSPMGKA